MKKNFLIVNSQKKSKCDGRTKSETNKGSDLSPKPPKNQSKMIDNSIHQSKKGFELSI